MRGVTSIQEEAADHAGSSHEQGQPFSGGRRGQAHCNDSQGEGAASCKKMPTKPAANPPEGRRAEAATVHDMPPKDQKETADDEQQRDQASSTKQSAKEETLDDMFDQWAAEPIAGGSYQRGVHVYAEPPTKLLTVGEGGLYLSGGTDG